MLSRRNKLMVALTVALLGHAALLLRREAGIAMPDAAVEADAIEPASVEAVAVSWPLPAPPPVVAAAAVGGFSTEASRNEYVDRVQRHLAAFAGALPAAASGEAQVRFTVMPDGGVSGVVLVRGSGNPAMDAIALALPLRAAPLPLPGEEAMRLQVPIRAEPANNITQ